MKPKSMVRVGVIGTTALISSLFFLVEEKDTSTISPTTTQVDSPVLNERSVGDVPTPEPTLIPETNNDLDIGVTVRKRPVSPTPVPPKRKRPVSPSISPTPAKQEPPYMPPPYLFTLVRDRWIRGEGNGPACDKLLSLWGTCGLDCAKLFDDCEVERKLELERIPVATIQPSSSSRIASNFTPIPLTRELKPPANCKIVSYPDYKNVESKLLCSGKWYAEWTLPNGEPITVWPPLDIVRDENGGRGIGSNLALEVSAVTATMPCPQIGTGWCISIETQPVE